MAAISFSTSTGGSHHLLLLLSSSASSVLRRPGMITRSISFSSSTCSSFVCPSNSRQLFLINKKNNLTPKYHNNQNHNNNNNNNNSGDLHCHRRHGDLFFFPPPVVHRASSFCSCSSSSSAAGTAPSQSQSQSESQEPQTPQSDSNNNNNNNNNDKSTEAAAVLEAAGLLDIRVGRILKARRHPEADSLYVEEVDVGESEPRTICSGLVNYVPLDQLQDSRVVVLTNLKPRNMRGIKSNGMLVAASDESHENVELLIPPERSVPGERIWFGSEDEKDRQPDAATPNQVQKKKIWEVVQPHLKTTDSCIAVLGVYPMRTSAGAVSCRSLKGARIS